MDKTAIRDAATVVLIRDRDTEPRVLMGQRGAAAAFMPSKFVFPGGAVDAEDAAISLAQTLNPTCLNRLADDSDSAILSALPAAAIREVWEETGLIIGQPGLWEPEAPDWQTYAATGHVPTAADFHFIFRAVTPPGRTRRFDARFFMVDAAAIQGDPDDFSRASDELSQLQWISLNRVREFDLPYITGVVLDRVAELLQTPDIPDCVPYFRNDDEDLHRAAADQDHAKHFKTLV